MGTEEERGSSHKLTMERVFAANIPPMSILTHRQRGGDESDGWIVIGPVSNPDYHSASVSAHLFPLHELRSSGI